MLKQKLTRRYVRFRIKCAAIWVKRKPWVRYIIKHKILLTITNISLVIRLVWMTNERNQAVEECAYSKKTAMYYKSESNALRKVYSDIPVSISEKKKIGKVFLMMSTNDYYNFQFLKKLKLKGYDYLGMQDEQIQDSTAAPLYNIHDTKIALENGREWFREPFVYDLDTMQLASFKATRIEYNKDTIVVGLYFDLEKLKKELNLKDDEKN